MLCFSRVYSKTVCYVFIIDPFCLQDSCESANQRENINQVNANTKKSGSRMLPLSFALYRIPKKLPAEDSADIKGEGHEF